jgi:hypothetical protein
MLPERPLLTTASALALVVVTSLTGGCSPGSGHNGCNGYCDRIVECTPDWALEFSDEQNCSWKFGEKEARDRCLTSCKLNRQILEDVTRQESRECLLCMADTIGESCSDIDEANAVCPCDFDGREYGVEAAPNIEPLSCDSGDVYFFVVSTEDGEFRREKCLSGVEKFCR